MKRFLVLCLSVLLILPVLLVPCFAAAASEYQFVFNTDLGIYVCPVELPSGSYTGLMTSEDGVFTIQQFDYLADFQPDHDVYVTFVPITLTGIDISQDIEFIVIYNPTDDLMGIAIEGVEDESIVIYLTPASSASSVYQFSYDSFFVGYLYRGELPSGFYTGVLATNSGVFSIQQFDYLPNYLPELGVFLTNVPITLISDDYSSNLNLIISYDPSEDVTGIYFDDASYYSGVINLTSVSSSESTFISDLVSIAQTIFDWCSQIAQMIVSRPLLLFTVGTFFLGGCIALFSRFLSRG